VTRKFRKGTQENYKTGIRTESLKIRKSGITSSTGKIERKLRVGRKWWREGTLEKNRGRRKRGGRMKLITKCLVWTVTL